MPSSSSGAYARAPCPDRGHPEGQEDLAAPWRSCPSGVASRGLGVAGSVALTGAAQHTTLTATVSTNDLPRKTSRAAERSRLDPAIVKSLADQRAELLSKIDSQVTAASMDRSAAARARALEVVSDATRRQAVLLARGNSAPSNRLPSAQDANTSKGCLPITGGYSIAARFGQLGPWSRYHTGLELPLPGRHTAPRSCLWCRYQLGLGDLDLPAAGLATMSPSSTRMAPIP